MLMEGVWPDVFDGDWGNLTKISKSHWTMKSSTATRALDKLKGGDG
jgi:hypothetical protein